MDEIYIPMGERILNVVEQRKMSICDFAAAVGFSRTAAYYTFKRKEVQTKTLKRISEVLEYDFFQHLTTDNFKHYLVQMDVSENLLKRLLEEFPKESIRYWQLK